MKKIILTAALAMFGMVGSASALTFSEVVDLGGAGVGNDWITWEHSAPADFEVPYDIINDATISISYTWIDTPKGEGVKFDGQWIGSLGTSGDFWSSDIFDVSSYIAPFANGDLFSLKLKINENWDGYGRDYKLGASTFNLNYDNVSAPVPEPSTILLFGAGLAGLVGYSRKRSNKKA